MAVAKITNLIIENCIPTTINSIITVAVNSRETWVIV